MDPLLLVERSPALEYLNLSQISLTLESIDRLVALLQSDHAPNLRALNLSQYSLSLALLS